jgi:hypothetical protein
MAGRVRLEEEGVLAKGREVLANVLAISSKGGCGIMSKLEGNIFAKPTDQIFLQLHRVRGSSLVGRTPAGDQGPVEMVLCRVLRGQGSSANRANVVNNGREGIGSKTVARGLAVQLMVKQPPPCFEDQSARFPEIVF